MAVESDKLETARQAESPAAEMEGVNMTLVPVQQPVEAAQPKV